MAVGLLVAIGALAGLSVPPSGAAQTGPDGDGIVARTVVLAAGFDGASTADVAAHTVGARVEVPPQRSSLLIKASVDAAYRVRFRIGASWGDPLSVAGEVDEGPDPDGGTERALGPIRVPVGAEELELVLSGGADDRVEALFVLDAAPAAVAEGGAPVVAGAQQVRAGEQPPIMPRSSWATEGWAFATPGCEEGPRYADNLQAVVIHHTVTTNNYGPDEVDDILRAIYYGHVRVNGWCDVGYNFLVDRFGTIWEGRTGGIDRPVIGGHAKGFNTSTMGVAMLGQHHPGASPRAARPATATAEAIESLAAWKLQRHGVDPAGTTWLKNRSSRGAQRLTSGRWHLVPTVLAHRDVGTTSCPGDHGVAVVRALGPELGLAHPGSAPYAHPAWRPAPVGSGFVTVDATGGLRPAGTAALSGIGAPVAAIAGSTTSASAVAVAARREGQAASGYRLHADGVLTPFGTSPAVADRPAGAGSAVDVALAPSGGWVVGADGTLHGFGGQTDRSAGAAGEGDVIRATVDEAGRGYLLTAGGRLRPAGGAPALQPARAVERPVDVAARPAGAGGWVLDADGRLTPFGDAPEAAITSPRRPGAERRYRAIVAAPSGVGGWLLTDDGQLWPFGGARLVPAALTDAEAGNVADVALVVPVATADFVAGPTGRFLGAAIDLFLDRPATPADLDHWEGLLTYQGGGRQSITIGLARSEEWAGQRIDAMYRHVLGRSADEAGRRYWLSRLAAGVPLNEIGVYFYGSEEYVVASGTSEGYVTRLYRVLLEREPEPAGLGYWAGELDAGRAAPPDVAAGFYASIESRRGRVVGLYQEVLDRDPDPDGLSYWAQQLLAADDVVLAADLAASDEFYARALG